MKRVAVKLVALVLACMGAVLVIVQIVGYGAKRIGIEVEKYTVGGEAYPYVFADESDVRDGKDELRLWLGSAKGPTYYVAMWVSPAEAKRDPNDERYWSLPAYKDGKQVIYEGATLMGKTIKPGSYYIEMSARNGTVVERLDIADNKQTIELVRRGETLAVPKF